MSSRCRERLGAVVLAAAIALLASTAVGCGEEKPEPSEITSQHLAEFDVIDQAVRDGTLGTPEEVRASMQAAVDKARPDANGKVWDTQFFDDDDGHLVPIEEMNGHQLGAYSYWRWTPFVYDKIGGAITRAGVAAE